MPWKLANITSQVPLAPHMTKLPEDRHYLCCVFWLPLCLFRVRCTLVHGKYPNQVAGDSHGGNTYNLEIGKWMDFIVVWFTLKKLVQFKSATLCLTPGNEIEKS